jgi:hypothetical protein
MVMFTGDCSKGLRHRRWLKAWMQRISRCLKPFSVRLDAVGANVCLEHFKVWIGWPEGFTTACAEHQDVMFPRLKCACPVAAWHVGDGVLRPFNLHTALGQALMQASSLPPVSSSLLATGLNRQVLSRITAGVVPPTGLSIGRMRLVPGSHTTAAMTSAGDLHPMAHDFYEHHFLLQQQMVMMITNCRVALIHAPGEVAPCS